MGTASGGFAREGIVGNARITALSPRPPRNGIPLSDSVHAQIRGKVAEALTGVGALALKSIAAPVRAWLGRRRRCAARAVAR